MLLVLFRLEGSHRLPPTNLSPGDMVCIRLSNTRGAGATSCMQGFVNCLDEDGCTISVALESRPGNSSFSKLVGKSVRIDRIHGLADAVTYEVPVYAMLVIFNAISGHITFFLKNFQVVLILGATLGLIIILYIQMSSVMKLVLLRLLLSHD